LHPLLKNNIQYLLSKGKGNIPTAITINKK
jgi:hypothetical protein